MRHGSSADTNQRAFRLLGYLLVFFMMVCGILTVGNLIHTLVPHWHSGVIAGILLFIVTDRLYTFRQLKALTFLTFDWTLAIGAQWVIIMLLTRLLLSYANGLDALRADLLLLGRGYITDLVTPEFVVGMLLALLIWFFVGQFLYVLDDIGLEQETSSDPESAAVQGEPVPAHQRLVTLAFSVGIVLVVLTAMARLDYRAMFADTQGLPSLRFTRFAGAEAGVLLYFVFGLALLSLSRLMSLQTHWNQMRIRVSSANLYRQWGVYSLLFLVLLAMIVSLLPAGDSLGFFSLLGMLFNYLVDILFFLGQLVLSLLLLLFSLPFALFGQGPPVWQPSAPLPPVSLPPAPPASPPANNALWALVRSILLWGTLAVVILYAVRQFLGQHGGLGMALRTLRMTNWLILAWQWLYRQASSARLSVSLTIGDGWQRLVTRLGGTRSVPGLRPFRLRALDPRRQVYFFYLAMVRRGGEQGLSRKPSQTPDEYAGFLEKALPSVGEDIDALTEAFITARYSRREVDAGDAGRVKSLWARIRRALQAKSKDQS